MMLFKACPTCRGDLHVERDFDTRVPPDLVCLQCGRYLRPDELRSMLSRRSGRTAETVAGAAAP